MWQWRWSEVIKREGRGNKCERREKTSVVCAFEAKASQCQNQTPSTQMRKKLTQPKLIY